MIDSFSPRGPTTTLDDSEKWMSGILRTTESPNRVAFGAYGCRVSSANEALQPSDIGSSERMKGIITLLPRESGMFELGYIFHPDFWGQGLATEAVKAVVSSFLDEEGKGLRVIAKVHAANGGSRRVLQKVGMTEESMEGRDVLVYGSGGEGGSGRSDV